MIKRFVIAAILVALFLGGVGYFNLVFKPKMIGEFMAKMAPPAATVTAERAGTEEWVDRVQSIGTLIAIQGVDVAPEVAGIVKNYYFDSGEDVEKGSKLVELDTSVEEADLAKNRAILLEANADLERQSSLVKQGGRLAGRRRHDHLEARHRRGRPCSAWKRSSRRRTSPRRSPAGLACAGSRRANM